MHRVENEGIMKLCTSTNKIWIVIINTSLSYCLSVRAVLISERCWRSLKSHSRICHNMKPPFVQKHVTFLQFSFWQRLQNLIPAVVYHSHHTISVTNLYPVRIQICSLLLLQALETRKESLWLCDPLKKHTRETHACCAGDISLHCAEVKK